MRTSILYAGLALASFMDSEYGDLSIDQKPMKDHSHEHHHHDHSHGHADGGVQAEYLNLPGNNFYDDLDAELNGPLYAGIQTFAHLGHVSCFDPANFASEQFDIALVGAPFDTAVTYRSGARFGPAGIRKGSRRMSPGQVSPYREGFMLYNDWAKFVDCGDVAMHPLDNRYALNQLYRGMRAVHNHTTSTQNASHIPRAILMGGDHTTTLSALQAIYEKIGPVSVVHFDSHIDTWDPLVLGGNVSSYMQVNHGTFLHYAAERGYLNHGHNLHVGSRAPYVRKHGDIEHDKHCGFAIVNAREIDEVGISGVIQKIKDRVGDTNVYISVDIDVLDPVYAPGTGTAEPGGYTTREFMQILDGLEGINIVGADVVEVAPAYDGPGDVTLLAAAQVIDSLATLMVINGPLSTRQRTK